jgi:large subunit ribosomal protein L18
MRTEYKQRLAQLRHWRVRRKVCGTKERPRMSVCFTNEHIYVQFIDDEAGRTLAAASTRSKATPDRDKLAANVASAKAIGAFAAKTALDKGIKQVVFDRGGARYHWSKPKAVKVAKDGKDGKGEKGDKGEKAEKGKAQEAKPVYGKLAALAAAAREAGLQF